MSARTVLLIDDDIELGALLGDFLARYDIACLCAHKGRDGLRKLRDKTPDLVILDIMLPEACGAR